jgi:hypothetical protein
VNDVEVIVLVAEVKVMLTEDVVELEVTASVIVVAVVFVMDMVDGRTSKCVMAASEPLQ